eukprot:Pgem_evm1s18197
MSTVSPTSSEQSRRESTISELGAMPASTKKLVNNSDAAAHNFTTTYLRNAGFLAIFSSFILIEGSVRISLQVANVRTNGGRGASDVIPPGLLLFGAVCEVVFGLTGMALALSVLIYDYLTPCFALCTLLSEQLGWIVFILLTVADPINTNPQFPALESTAQNNFANACNVMGGILYCAILQGGQMFFTLQLYRLKKGENEGTNDMTFNNVFFYQVSLIISSGIMLLAGLTQWWIGAMGVHVIGNGELSTSEAIIGFYIGIWPELNIFTGLWLTVVSCYALFVGFTYKVGPSNTGVSQGKFHVMGPLMLVTLLVQITTMGWVSSSVANMPPFTAVLMGLTLLMSLLPAVLDAKLRT